jgi:hypothetical protein
MDHLMVVDLHREFMEILGHPGLSTVVRTLVYLVIMQTDLPSQRIFLYVVPDIDLLRSLQSAREIRSAS